MLDWPEWRRKLALDCLQVGEAEAELLRQKIKGIQPVFVVGASI